jgi:hypothetical protein
MMVGHTCVCVWSANLAEREIGRHPDDNVIRHSRFCCVPLSSDEFIWTVHFF